MKNCKSDIVKIMPCLDMQNGRVVKGVQFENLRDAGDPAQCAAAYCEAGADEIALLDITATLEKRSTMLEVVKNVAAVVTVPFSVGGGICDVSSAEAALEAGATKVSVSSAAFRNPGVIAEMVKKFGSQKIVVAVDAAVNAAMKSGYEVYIDGGTTATGCDVSEWFKRIDGFGVGAILPTSKNADGAKCGYSLSLIRAARNATNADVIASGGAGTLRHFVEAVEAGASILLAASVFHFKTIGIAELKEYLKNNGVLVRS